eukprot:scaffold132_cov170-Amphora_coffeaeformis.AAC.59
MYSSERRGFQLGMHVPGRCKRFPNKEMRKLWDLSYLRVYVTRVKRGMVMKEGDSTRMRVVLPF